VRHVTSDQPDGTPTWIDLAIPDLDRAVAFYPALVAPNPADTDAVAAAAGAESSVIARPAVGS
jgi:hypothetical protein